MELLLQTVVNGLLIGGLYIAISLGLSLSFGVMDIVDFAVGEWVMVGAFTAFLLQQATGWDPIVLMPASFVVTFVLGWVIHPLLQRAIGGRSPRPALMSLVFTFGVATILRGTALSTFGYDVRSIQTRFTGNVEFLGEIPTLRLLAGMIAATLTILALFVLYRTRFGMAVRAAAEDKVSAALQGVDVRQLSNVIYAFHSGLTGMAGAVLGALFSVSAEMGMRYTIFAFFIVVLAGMGYIPGVIVGSLGLGLLQSFVATYVGAQYTLLILFAALYLALLLAPKGVFGKGV